jgi:acyl homoserine lactone synthase
MLRILDHSGLAHCPQLVDSMLRDRAAQFVDRHGWSLSLGPDGREVDEFDAPGTLYCILEEDGRHLASVRLRPARDGSMVERHFQPLWDAFGPELHSSWEVTRLLLAPGRAGQNALGELLIGLCGLCLRQGISSFFGVVFPSVARVLSRAGWAPQVLGRLERDGETLLLASWQATHLVHWTLQARQDGRLQAADGTDRVLAAA